MVAYRAEDISQRLVPHQLYIREELERSVQFDVRMVCLCKACVYPCMCMCASGGGTVHPQVDQEVCEASDQEAGTTQETHRKPLIERHCMQTQPSSVTTTTLHPFQVSHNAYRPDRRDKSLLWTPLIASDGREEEPVEQEETSEEEEEEVDHLKESITAWRHSTIPLQPKVEDEATEMHTLDSDLDRLHDPHLVKSYTRLESAPFLHFKQPQQQQQQQQQGGGAGGGAGGGDKWHEWVSLQKDWMNKVDENPDSYFDDCL